MDIENWEIIFHSFLRKELTVYVLYKRASKFQILSVSTETSRETTNAMRRQDKSHF